MGSEEIACLTTEHAASSDGQPVAGGRFRSDTTPHGHFIESS